MAQAQAQSQAQASTASQVQPGVMVQRQRRTQIAMQDAVNTERSGYSASALRSRSPGAAIAVMVGAMMFGLGILTRRPRWARGGAPWRRQGRP